MIRPQQRKEYTDAIDTESKSECSPRARLDRMVHGSALPCRNLYRQRPNGSFHHDILLVSMTPIRQRPRYQAVIFDMDGTITQPVLDFLAIRREIGLPEGDIAKTIAALPEEPRKRAWQIIERYELLAEDRQQLQDGAKELLERCRSDGIRIGLITRNIQRSVDALCRKFDLTFDHVITREFPHIKPHPAPIQHMLKRWNVSSSQALMVGDYIHDIDCGRAAGTATCFYLNAGARDHGATADFTVRSMADLETHLWKA